MSKAVVVCLLAVLLVPARFSEAHSHGWGFPHHPGPHPRVFSGFGPGWWWGPGFVYGPYPYAYPFGYPYGWYYPPPYYAYPAFGSAPPQVYVQQEPPAARETAPRAYWYYCASVEGYYPTVKQCPEAWIKVPPMPR